MNSLLFTPLSLGGLTLDNRIVIAPMCQYSASDGIPGMWHNVHLGQLAQSGAGLVIVEATAVVPEGRISPGCPGLYSDASEAAFAALTTLHRTLGTGRIGIQLSHAGRKAATAIPWLGAGPLAPDAGGWKTVAPSPLPYDTLSFPPHALTEDELGHVVAAFASAARRAVRAGFELIEIHAAHGYLLHEFLSPLSNLRTDRYGGTLENRLRFPLEVFEAIRAAVPQTVPVTVRISATDWIPGGWNVQDSIHFCTALKERGCALIHVSSGGLGPEQKIVTGPGYQVAFAAEIRRETGVPVIAVGQITDPVQAETILKSGQADAIGLARAILWNPRWPWHAAQTLGAEIALPPQYARCAPALRGRPFIKGDLGK